MMNMHMITVQLTLHPSSATNLYDSRFFVITDEYNVYKCIRTGRDTSGAVVVSDIKPTGTSATTLVETADSNACLRSWLYLEVYVYNFCLRNY